MNDIDREERIRVRAHEIWEREGRPEGMHEEHWEQARREIGMEDGDDAGLQRTLTDAIGLAVGLEPDEERQPDADRQAAGEPPAGDPAAGDRGVVEPEPSLTKGAAKPGKATRPAKTKLS